ncbi:hypothetical protein VULLAG_LOCUS22981 [Vulpes lagopus]
MSSVGPEGSLQGTCQRREVAWGPCRLGGRTVAALAGRPCPSLLRPHSRPHCEDKQQATPAPAEPGDRSSWDRTLAEPPARLIQGSERPQGPGRAQVRAPGQLGEVVARLPGTRVGGGSRGAAENRQGPGLGAARTGFSS